MRTVKDLVSHLNKYKDAVIILGPGALEVKDNYSIEEFNENYTRKALVREPEKLWNFFIDKMYREATSKEEDLFKTIKFFEDITGLVINQNMIAHTIGNSIDLHGSIHKFICPKCKINYTTDYIFSREPYECECEVCGATLRPTALLSGERYNKLELNKIEDAILSTHTIILIGMDYTEEALMKLIAHYGDVKSFINEKGEEQKVLVSIQTQEEELNPNEMANSELIVRDDIQSALNRLRDNF